MSAGGDGPHDECDLQDQCLTWDVEESSAVTLSEGEECGGAAYEVCVYWDKEREECKASGKNDYFTEVCSGPEASDLVTNWPDGEENEVCRTVCCGETADFGLADGDFFGTGCSAYTEVYTTERNGHKGECKYDGGMCCEMGGNDCTWSIEVPQCTPEPTAPTPRPTYPTPDPTTEASTDEPQDPCDCYSTWIFDDNDDYLLVEGEKGYEEGVDNYKYCYVWLVKQNLRGDQSRVCNDTLIGVELGVCSDPYVTDLDDIIVDYTGCDNLYAYYDPELDLNGLYCEIYVDEDYDPNGSKNEVLTICLRQPMFNEVCNMYIQ